MKTILSLGFVALAIFVLLFKYEEPPAAAQTSTNPAKAVIEESKKATAELNKAINNAIEKPVTITKTTDITKYKINLRYKGYCVDEVRAKVDSKGRAYIDIDEIVHNLSK